MNDKITKQKIYSDFSIRLDKLEYKLDKLLALMEEPKTIVNNISVQDWTQQQVDKFNNRPPQWPNESYIDYMKRIGELNTAQSDEEVFTEGCK